MDMNSKQCCLIGIQAPLQWGYTGIYPKGEEWQTRWSHLEVTRLVLHLSAAFGYGATKGAGFIHMLVTSAIEDTLGYLNILIRLLDMPPGRLEQQLEAGGTTWVTDTRCPPKPRCHSPPQVDRAEKI